jgi:hypothetical protein
VFIAKYSWYFIVTYIFINFNYQLYMFLELWGYFRQFLIIHLNSQPSHQTVKLGTSAFPAQPAFSTQQLSFEQLATDSPNKQALSEALQRKKLT